MELIEVISLACIGAGAFALQWKKNFRFVGFLNLLLVVSTVLFLKQFVIDILQEQLYLLLAILGLNFIAAQFKVLQKVGLRVVLPLISFAIYFFIFKNESITILGEEYTTVNKFLVSGVILSLLAFEFGAIKEFTLTKLFKGLESAEIVKSVMILLIAFSIFLGGFASASFGMLMIASAFITASFYRNDESQSYGISLLTLPILAGLLSLTGETEVNLIGGDVLEGLFIGVFGAYFIGHLWQTSNRLILFLGYFLFIVFSIGILLLQTVHSLMGGMDAFVGVLIGAAIVNLVKGKEYVGQTIFVLLLLIGSVTPFFMQIEAQDLKEEAKENNSTEIVEKIPEVVLNLNELKGAYQLNSSSSNITFILGEKGETKGKFSNVTGEFIFGEELETTNISIVLDMKNFSTFNGFRDKSLRGEDYFKTDKFPVMTYKGNKLVKTGENQFEINGKFMMLGVVKELNVSLAGIEKENKNFLIGKGEIDRREFGMSPSATEGNVVRFEYEVELKK